MVNFVVLPPLPRAPSCTRVEPKNARELEARRIEAEEGRVALAGLLWRRNAKQWKRQRRVCESSSQRSTSSDIPVDSASFLFVRLFIDYWLFGRVLSRNWFASCKSIAPSLIFENWRILTEELNLRPSDILFGEFFKFFVYSIVELFGRVLSRDWFASRESTEFNIWELTKDINRGPGLNQYRSDSHFDEFFFFVCLFFRFSRFSLLDLW